MGLPDKPKCSGANEIRYARDQQPVCRDGEWNRNWGAPSRADEDQVPGRDAVIVLDHSLWEQQFSADRSITWPESALVREIELR